MKPGWLVGLLLDGYWQPRHAAASAVSGAKTLVHKEFGEAMERDYWSASKKFWQTVRCLHRGKQCSTNTVYSGCHELLTSTEEIILLRGSPQSL